MSSIDVRLVFSVDIFCRSRSMTQCNTFFLGALPSARLSWPRVPFSFGDRLRRHGLVVLAAVSMATFGGLANAATAEDLNADAAQALATLYKTNPVALNIGKKARATLIFPKITKAGLVFGGSYGEGVLMKGSTVSGYYNSVSASWGWQAGAESYGYIVFLMNEKAMSYLNASKGWEVGADPSVVMVNEGVAKNLSTSTLKGNAYAFAFDQQGLMASLSIEGTKISRIKR
jgi:lipid-binding SYLF domain-containing protein